MPDGAAQPDLLAPLDPPAADLALRPGTVEGPPEWWEGFGAGLRAWCGPLHGWRDFGELLPARGDVTGGLMLHKGRLTIALVWDLGAAPLRRRAAEDDADPGEE
jgi:hypothetical protein